MKPLLFLLVYCCFTGKVNSQMLNSGRVTQSHLDPFPTEASVQNTLKKGMKRETVMGVFGKPNRHDDLPGGASDDVYEMKPDSRPINWRDRFSGFKIYYDQNRVVKFLPIYSDMTLPVTNTVLLDSKTGRDLRSSNIAFYVVERHAFNRGHYIDMPILTKPGYIKSNPDLIVTNVESVELMASRDNSREEKPYIVNIHLTKEYANEFEKFSRTNITKQILMMVSNHPVWAGIVISPISNGQFQIRNLDKSNAQQLMKDFK